MPDGAPLDFHKVLALPGALDPDAIYFVKLDGNLMSIVVTSDSGVAHSLRVPQHLDVSFGSSGRPAAGAEFGRYLAPRDMTIVEALGRAISAAPAAQARSLTISRGDGQVMATFDWAAGATVATLDVQLDTVEAGDVLIFTAPAVQDATLSGINATLVLER